MIRTYLRFDLAPGKAEGFVAFFGREAILTTAVAQEGCHSAELTLSADRLQALVTAVWDDQEAYDRWTSRSDRSDLAAELGSFLRDGVLEPGVAAAPFDVVLDGG